MARIPQLAGQLTAQDGMRGIDLQDLTHADLQSMGIERCTDRKAILR